MRTITNKVGKVFGKLTVIAHDAERSLPGRQFVIVRCECGTEKSVRYDGLRSGAVVSCNCGKKEHCLVHGGNRIGLRTPEYMSWDSMLQRCSNQKSPAYKHYGGRGITVDVTWLSFAAFLKDMGARPSTSHSLERVDNGRGYSKDNCVWATHAEQMRNTRRTIFITHLSKTQCVTDWAIEYGLSVAALLSRVRRGWDFQRALTTPTGRYNRAVHQ